MNRKYWAGVMFFSLLVTVGAGYFTYSTLKQKTTVEVPLTKVEPKPVESIMAPTVVEAQPTQIPTEVPKTEKTEKAPKVEEITESPALAKTINENNSVQIRNILFTYKKASAKEVYLIGSFNKWTRESMKKNKKGLWECSVKLKPGTYEYKFVVDERRIKDPNNKLYNPAGNSILKVKPLADK